LEGRRETLDLREALEQANSVLQRVEREIAGGGGGGGGWRDSGRGNQEDNAADANNPNSPNVATADANGVTPTVPPPIAVTIAVSGKRDMTPEQRTRERERGERERERARVEKERHRLAAGIYHRPPVNHGDLLELVNLFPP
jgi:hypothetical protein